MKVNGYTIGPRADLRWASLYEANLYEADLRWANLRGANLRGANLRGADLRGADLRGADLSGANLSEADLSEADLRWAYLRWAYLSGADLSGADLSEATLWGCIGNNKEIKSLQCGTYLITYTSKVLQIGCKQYPIDKWWGFRDSTIDKMGTNALSWWKIWKPILKQILEVSPATPTKG